MNRALLLLLAACGQETVSENASQVIAECLCDEAELPSPSAPEVDPTCMRPTSEAPLDPEVAWAWTGSGHPHTQVMMTPVAAPMVDDNGDGSVTGEDVPRVAFTAWDPETYWRTGSGALVVLRGDTGEEELYLPVLQGPDGEIIDRPAAAGGVAIGDLEGDGSPDLCVTTMEATVVCLEADGTFKWKGIYLGPVPASDTKDLHAYPAIADLDHDGDAEVVVGNHIFDSDGTLQGLGAFGSGASDQRSAMPAIADMNQDGFLDVVTGHAVYDRFGATIWAMPAPYPDAPVAIADLDLDGIPEIVMSHGGVILLEVGGSVEMSWLDLDPPVYSGAPLVVDVNGDGEPEIGVALRERYVLVGADGVLRWEAPTHDASSQTGASAVDLDGDGRPEILYADEERLYVFDGLTGDDRFATIATDFDPTSHASFTWHEYPVPVDLDRDGSLEVLLASNTSHPEHDGAGWTGVRAIRSASRAWMPARPVWNQYAYSIDHVGDDASIPLEFLPSYLTHNSFRATGMNDGALADLVLRAPQVCELACDYGAAGFWVEVGNAGLADAGPFDVAVTAGGVDVVSQHVNGLASGASTMVGPFLAPTEPWSELLFVVVAPGVQQCAEDNDLAVVADNPCP